MTTQTPTTKKATKRASPKNPTQWPRTRAEAQKLIADIRRGVYLPGESIPSARTFSAGEVPGYMPMAIYTVTGMFKLVKEAGLVEFSTGRRLQVRPFEQWPEGSFDRDLMTKRIWARYEKMRAAELSATETSVE